MEKVIELWLAGGMIYKPVPPLRLEEVLRAFSEANGFFLLFERPNETHRIPKHAIVNIVTKKDPS